jgi:4-nitrophenol 2-monooxygenase / 4-nitrocatechol 4-monooxygenase, reductase component
MLDSGLPMTMATEPPVSPIDETLFREVIGRFASGVTIITTTANGVDYGTTASAVASLSMAPPMILVCLNETSETQGAIRQSERFIVNILGCAPNVFPRAVRTI